MKYRIFSVLVILAMVASLCAVAVVPASAQVNGLTVEPDTYDANKTARYEFNFDAGTQINVGDSISIQFASAFQVPESISSVTVDGATCEDVSVEGNTVKVYPGTPVSGNVTVTIGEQQDVKNPQLSNDYDISVWATGQASDTDTITINEWFTVSPTGLAAGDTADIEGAGFKAGYTATLSSVDPGQMPLQGNGQVQPDGTVDFKAYGTGNSGTPNLSDGSGREAVGPFIQAVPHLEVSPASGLAGSWVEVMGYNFSGSPIAPGTIQLAGNDWIDVADIEILDLDNDGAEDDIRATAQIDPFWSSGPQEITVEDTDSEVMATPVEFDVTQRAISPSPGSGAPGSSVTLEGAGFYPEWDDGVAYLMYGNTPSGGTISKNIEVDDEGNFTTVGTIPDEAVAGMRGIVVMFQGQMLAQTAFNVSGRSLSVVPESGPFGPEITLSGGNLGSNTPKDAKGSLFVNGVQVGTVTLSSTGDLVPENVKVAKKIDGIEPVFKTGANVIEVTYDGRSAEGVYEVVRPGIDLDKSQGPRGTQIIVEGSGWHTSPTSYVTIMVDGVNAQMVQPDGNGDIWAQITVASDADTGEAMQVWATQGDNESLKETFMVTAPAVEVDPEAAPVGAEVAIIGTGFGVQQPLMSIKIGNVNVVWGQDLPITDSQGGFEVSATVPGLTPGGKSVSVEDAENNTYTVPFTITGDGETGVISVEDGLATIDGLYTIVWTFDSEEQEWQVFDVAEGAPDDFTDLNKGQGYWIQVTEDCTLTYGSATYNLNEGWNLIGWLG